MTTAGMASLGDYANKVLCAFTGHMLGNNMIFCNWPEEADTALSKLRPMNKIPKGRSGHSDPH